MNSYEYLHLCAIHPDLQIMKLVIDLPTTSVSKTIRTDLKSLFGMPLLQKITISGNWGSVDDIKYGLIDGLRYRARSCPLKKVALELERSDHYKMREFQVLCETIFSLPKLEDLKVVFGKGFGDIILQPRYEGIVYTSWVRKAFRVQLKSICLQTNKSDLKHLPLITPNLSFSLKEKDNIWAGDLYAWSDFIGGYGYYDSDEDDYYGRQYYDYYSDDDYYCYSD